MLFQLKTAEKTTYLSIVGNFFLALTKAVVGILGNSYALIADAIESTSDIFSSIIVLIGLKVSAKPADKNHPYGHGKAEAIATFFVAAFLIISATIICFQSVHNIQTPHKLPASYTLIFLLFVIAFKEFFYRFVKKRSKRTNSSLLKADAWHHRSDAITSLAAFIGISIALYLGDGYESADDWAALVTAGIIFYNSYLIVRPAFGEIMDEHQYEDLEKKVRILSLEVDGIIDTEKCLIRKMGTHYIVDLHITVNSMITVKAGHDIAHLLKDHLKDKLPFIWDVMIHIEPDDL